VIEVLFFRYIKPIILYSCLGTVFSIFGAALVIWVAVANNLTGAFQPHLSEILVFCSLISSTDPVSTLAVFQKKRVDPQLFYLVFGESLLNDAVCLVLFNTLSKYVDRPDSGILYASIIFLVDFVVSFVGSMALGLFCGLGSALVLKTVDLRHTKLTELSLYVIVMYFPFFLAEVLHLSGIVAILFTGMAAKHYASCNLSEETDADADAFFRLIANLAEIVIFLEMGLSVFGLSVTEEYYALFILWSILACLVARACNVYPITFLHNKMVDFEIQSYEKEAEKNEDIYFGFNPNAMVISDLMQAKIEPKKAHMMWFSGLRGAVAYACAKKFPDYYNNRTPFVYVTMIMVMTTIFLLGSTTEAVLSCLNIDIGVDPDSYMQEVGTRTKVGFWARISKCQERCPLLCHLVVQAFCCDSTSSHTFFSKKKNTALNNFVSKIVDTYLPASYEATRRRIWLILPTNSYSYLYHWKLLQQKNLLRTNKLK
jgi:NhaP-type Na+/H+ or K+/H+ antiporter